MENEIVYGKTLRLRFKENDTLQRRIQKSIKFLNQMYGASVKQVQEILKVNETFDIIPEENNNGMSLMLSEYAKSSYGKQKSGKATPSRRGSVKMSPFKKTSKLAQLGFGLAKKVKKLGSSKGEKSGSRSHQKNSVSSQHQSYNDSPLDSPKNVSKTLQKKSRFAPGGTIFVDPSPAAKEKTGKDYQGVFQNLKSRTIDFEQQRNDLVQQSQTPNHANSGISQNRQKEISSFKIMVNNLSQEVAVKVNPPKEDSVVSDNKPASKTDFKIRVPSRQSSMNTKDSYDISDLDFRVSIYKNWYLTLFRTWI